MGGGGALQQGDAWKACRGDRARMEVGSITLSAAQAPSRAQSSALPPHPSGHAATPSLSSSPTLSPPWMLRFGSSPSPPLPSALGTPPPLLLPC